MTRRPGRRRDDRVVVAHPHDLLDRQVAEQRRLDEGDVGLPVLGDVVRLDLAAEVLGHQLHPVADAERRDAELEHAGVDVGRAVCVDGGRATREDQRGGVACSHLGGGQSMRDELGVHARLADPPCDQLAVLAAEVEHEHRPLLRTGLRPWERDHLGRLRHGGSSVRPS